jgi:hypothetical protein
MGNRPFGWLIHGISGVGKTEWAANFPEVGFVIDPQEHGINDLLEFNRCPEPVFVEEVDTWPSLLDQCDIIAAGETGCKTVAFDSSTGLELLCHRYHCEEYFEGDWSKEGFLSFQQGPASAAKTDWPNFIEKLDNIRAAGINVLIIAHSQVKDFKNPDGDDFQRWIPYLHKESWQKLHRWAQCIFFYNFFVDVKKKGTTYKADLDSEARQIYTEWSPSFDAKNRFGLDPVIEAGTSGAEAYENFKEAYRKAMKRAKRK